MTPFKSVINDMYARDISKKVKTALTTKAMNGESIKPFEPYGYKKDPNNKNKIIIDEEVAGNVSKIFELYYGGLTKKQICDYLENNSIPTPLKYKEMTSNYKSPNFRTYSWCSTSINKILRNRAYVGDLVQNKTQKISYKLDKRIKNHPSQYIIVSNNHEAIVNREVFNTVQDMLDKQTNEWSYYERKPHLLQGLAFCSCGARITYNKNHGKHIRCICSKYKNKGAKFCSNIHLKEDELISKVIDNLRAKIQEVLKQGKLNYNDVWENSVRPLDNAKLIEQKMLQINNILKSVYEDKINNVISQDTFLMLTKDYEKQKEQLLKQLKSDIGTDSSAHLEIKTEQLEKMTKEILKLKVPEEVPKTLLNKLINKIIINDKDITVEYKFKCIRA